MKAAVLTELNKPLEIQRLPDPAPGPNDAVIRVEASGICRTDWHLWRGDFTWSGLNLTLPAVLGHEFGGTVEATGSAVQGFQPGDRVAIPFNRACGHCTNCYSGHSNPKRPRSARPSRWRRRMTCCVR